jgi:hypothetical protein
MAEDLYPTIAPGMVGLRNKETKVVSAHFPVDAREILTISQGEYEMVDNGAVEAARMNANPLKALETSRALIHSEVVGIEGQVLVAMSEEDAEKWRAMSAAPGETKGDPVVTQEKDTVPAKDPAKPADTAKAK